MWRGDGRRSLPFRFHIPLIEPDMRIERIAVMTCSARPLQEITKSSA